MCVCLFGAQVRRQISKEEENKFFESTYGKLANRKQLEETILRVGVHVRAWSAHVSNWKVGANKLKNLSRRLLDSSSKDRVSIFLVTELGGHLTGQTQVHVQCNLFKRPQADTLSDTEIYLSV